MKQESKEWTDVPVRSSSIIKDIKWGIFREK
jgi:hypothetical protein